MKFPFVRRKSCWILTVSISAEKKIETARAAVPVEPVVNNKISLKSSIPDQSVIEVNVFYAAHSIIYINFELT
jgi:hypothetical protein